MKKLFIVFCVLIGSFSCVAPRLSYKETIIVDYMRYSNIGFFVTESNSVSFDYTPIGSVTTIVVGETKVQDQETGRIKKRDYHIYDAIDEIVRQSRRMGSDGIIGLTLSPKLSTTGFTEGYIVSGMAIKRNI